MPRFDMDKNAHEILLKVKELMREEGIEHPTMSDAVRWLWEKALLYRIEKKAQS